MARAHDRQQSCRGHTQGHGGHGPSRLRSLGCRQQCEDLIDQGSDQAVSDDHKKATTTRYLVVSYRYPFNGDVSVTDTMRIAHIVGCKPSSTAVQDGMRWIE